MLCVLLVITFFSTNVKNEYFIGHFRGYNLEFIICKLDILGVKTVESNDALSLSLFLYLSIYLPFSLFFFSSLHPFALLLACNLHIHLLTSPLFKSSFLFLLAPSLFLSFTLSIFCLIAFPFPFYIYDLLLSSLFNFLAISLSGHFIPSGAPYGRQGLRPQW